MSDFKPTAAQAAAINTRGSAVLVSAGAGSGKTRVLTERLMSYLQDGENPAELDSFLIITFTRAAAGELRGRISQELAAALAKDPGSRRLRRQSALCSRAQIGTIHGFCAALLRENSHLAGLSPDFKIADEQRAGAMKAAALQKALERRYETPGNYPAFTLLADTVGAGRDDGRLGALVLSLHEKMQCHARPELWAKEQTALLQSPKNDAGETPWGREILLRAGESVDYWCGEFDRLMEAMTAHEKISRAYMQSFSQTGDALRELRRRLRLGWDEARACLPVPFPNLGRLVNSPDPVLSERLKDRRKACKSAMEELEKALYADSASLLAEMASTGPAMSALLSLTLDFDREYARAKSRAGLVDYSDLEHMTARLLSDENGRPTALAERVSRRYTEIMVDEYQDVSRVQDAIFRALSRDGKNLFMVGDVKQSIYRFRLADPGIFTEKYLNYADADKAAPGEPRRIMLQENFRSRREVLDCANSVFSLCMSRSLGDIDYDENAALKCGADSGEKGPLPQLLLLSLPKAGDDEENPDKTALEAQMVAAKIKALVEGGAELGAGDGRRPMGYGDVAILLRSANTVGGIYRRELARLGIPVTAGQSGGFFSSVEVSAIMSMLAVIDNPHQDIPLIAVLRSPAFGFSADELSAVRAADREADFYTALRKAGGNGGRCRAFLEKLERLRSEAPDMPAPELVWRISEELDLLAICSAMSDGERRRARIMELAELSERFESSGYRGLHRFVLWLRSLAEKGREPALGAESASAVQIMSVHRSKGLEFPVVFLCDTARRFNKQDSRDTVLVHPELGLGPKVTDLERRVEYPSLARNAIKLRLERELLSEEMRLLYVALTRPKERLYVTAAVKDPEQMISKAAASVSVPMAPELLAQAAAPVNWLLYAGLADGWRHMELKTAECVEEAAESPEAAPQRDAGGELLPELRRRLRFVYPFREAEALPSKVTATELKGRAEEDEDAQPLAPARPRPFRMPDFTRAGRPVTGAERGTATHLVLQYMDFGSSNSLESVKREIERLREARFISDREAQAVDAEAIVKLFGSPTGRRMLAAGDTLRREFKFSLLCPAEEIFGAAAGEKLLLQGVVDCFLEEEGELVIIDYKTDYVPSQGALREKAALYSGQLRAYARALERICGKTVKDCVLYFLSAGAAVSLPMGENIKNKA